MKLNQEQKDEFKIRLLNYLNSNDFFWSEQIRASLNIVSSNTSINPRGALMLHIFRALKNKGILGVSDTHNNGIKGTRKQYYRIEPKYTILITDFKQ